MEIKKDRKILVNNVEKNFKIGFQKSEGALARLLAVLSGREEKRNFKVLDDISLQVYSGENIGLIGSNGSGKSTLLRAIAGIYQIDKGVIETSGEVIYMNGFGLGLKPRLTMRDNVYLIGSIMGLGVKEIKENFPKIVEFSELEDFVDTKVYQFSSGMLNRLCFSTTIHCLGQRQLEIILLDEVFNAGGDIVFQNKALAKMEQFLRAGAAVIMVSHQLDLIQKYCHQAIWLENGKIKKTGSAQEVVNEYLADKN